MCFSTILVYIDKCKGQFKRAKLILVLISEFIWMQWSGCGGFAAMLQVVNPQVDLFFTLQFLCLLIKQDITCKLVHFRGAAG